MFYTHLKGISPRPLCLLLPTSFVIPAEAVRLSAGIHVEGIPDLRRMLRLVRDDGCAFCTIICLNLIALPRGKGEIPLIHRWG